MSEPAPKFSPIIEANFLSHLRHDLRNTLRPILEIPDWIEEDFAEHESSLPEGTDDNLRLLKTHANRLNNMIEDLLLLAGIGVATEDGPKDVEEILNDLINEISVPDVQFFFEISHRMSPIPSNDMRSLLDALLSNAIKHNDQNHGKIKVSCKKIKDCIQIAVADNGPGIDAAHHDHVLEAFKTLAPREQVEGSGLGLTIVKRIAAMHRGTVRIISPGKERGCCVVVRFLQT